MRDMDFYGNGLNNAISRLGLFKKMGVLFIFRWVLIPRCLGDKAFFSFENVLYCIVRGLSRCWTIRRLRQRI